MEYTETVIEHFSNPRNVGEISDADGVGTIGSEECGDMVKVWIKVANAHLVDIKYKVFGCPAAIAVCSMMTEIAMGKHVDDAYKVTDAKVAEALGGLPARKYHCSNLAASALQEAILNYVLKSPSQSNTITITTLVDNTANDNFQSEHGLSFWVEYKGKKILFDTGQTNIIIKNAERVSVNLANTDAVILSHGHYDHTGGLPAVLDIAAKAKIYLHPDAIEPKFSKRTSGIGSIGMSDSAKKAVQGRETVWTATPAQLIHGMVVTGQVPRINDFEDVGGAFFIDENCQKSDELLDDQAMFFDSPKGLIVLIGCAHAGVVNTLHYVAKLSEEKHIYAVIGGMHLLNASLERIGSTIEVFKQYDVQKIGLAHCTGSNATKKFMEVFPDQCFVCSVGTKIDF